MVAKIHSHCWLCQLKDPNENLQKDGTFVFAPQIVPAVCAGKVKNLAPKIASAQVHATMNMVYTVQCIIALW